MSWWNTLFGLRRNAEKSVRSPSSTGVALAHQARDSRADQDEATVIQLEDEAPRGRLRAFPRALPTPNLDAPENRRIQLPPHLEDRLVQFGRIVRAGQLHVPGMSTGSLEIVHKVDRENVELREVVELIERDPVLSGEIIKIANSAAFAGLVEIESVHMAVVRIGSRRLRELVLSLSMRSTLFRYANLHDFADEIWRQASSTAALARAMARTLGFDPDKAQLLGLMHDVGKIPLLLLLKEDLGNDPRLDGALLSKVFFLFHERAGTELARCWNLTEELQSVVGCHHRFTLNPSQPRSAAFVTFAHKTDLWLSLGREVEFHQLAKAPELDLLEVREEVRHELLALARATYVALNPETLPAADEPWNLPS